MGTDIRSILERIASEISAMKLHPTTAVEYDSGYIGARNDAFAIVQEAIDNLDDRPEIERGLSFEEMRDQAKRCACLGSDDYCPCQNVPDRETKVARTALSEAQEGRK
ncbi:hypothetical protein [Rhizobium rhizogenes]|uniref:hypothetical protein n=1 Tax=Rhizobium rhizogenes TaxID=359 RepID=UPI0022705919|nr:hypothetical protein [Rhizobium rhizogenes]